jgi:hypothetical protein
VGSDNLGWKGRVGCRTQRSCMKGPCCWCCMGAVHGSSARSQGVLFQVSGGVVPGHELVWSLGLSMPLGC